MKLQLLGPFPFESASAPEIALTFDDGPNEPFTSESRQHVSVWERVAP